jgi:hypothetical protein
MQFLQILGTAAALHNDLGSTPLGASFQGFQENEQFVHIRKRRTTGVILTHVGRCLPIYRHMAFNELRYVVDGRRTPVRWTEKSCMVRN